MIRRETLISFCWQHLLLLASLFVMTLGVSVCLRSGVGSSVISVLPYVFQNAGERHLAPALTIGDYTQMMNAILVLGQLLVLRRRFEAVQLFQLLIGFFFGYLIDLNMALTTWLQPETWAEKGLSQIAGCIILGVGIAFEVRCGSVTMPGEGFPMAVCKVTGRPFPRVKIIVDSTLVVLGVVACYAFFGQWMWHIIGPGTLLAMFFVGLVVKAVGKRIAWFDRVLAYRPGFRRYVYGLARMLYKHGK